MQLSMQSAIQKSSIPTTHMFVIKDLRDKHFDPVWHFHSEYQLFLVLQGTGTRFVGDSVKRFDKDELVFTGPDVPHLWRSNDIYFNRKSPFWSHGIVIYFNERFLGDGVMEKEEMTAVKKLFKRSARGLEFSGRTRSSVSAMMQELLSLQGVKSVIRLLEILHTLSASREYQYLSHKDYTNPFKEEEADRMNKVYAYVMDNFRKQVRLQDLANLLHMTATSFSRYFTMKTSRPFSRFLTDLRVQHACKLLLDEAFTVEQVCYECGFNTLSNFNKLFRDTMNQTPTEYRKQFL